MYLHSLIHTKIYTCNASGFSVEILETVFSALAPLRNGRKKGVIHRDLTEPRGMMDVGGEEKGFVRIAREEERRVEERKKSWRI